MTDHYYEPPDECCDDDQCRCIDRAIDRAIEDHEDRAQEWAERGQL